MIRRWVVCLPLSVVGVTGCMSEEWKAWVGPVNGGKNMPVPTPDKLPAASSLASSRVYELGAQIRAANKDVNPNIIFTTIGVPEPTIFHKGAMQMFISEGLVNRCKTDPELAAVLCSELGKMVSESQLAGPVNESEPPYAPRIGSDIVGGGGDPDMTRLAEQANWQKKNPRVPSALPVVTAANPNELSREYLSRAGYNPDELLRVAPLLRQAEANPKYERQLLSTKN